MKKKLSSKLLAKYVFFLKMAKKKYHPFNDSAFQETT